MSLTHSIERGLDQPFAHRLARSLLPKDFRRQVYARLRWWARQRTVRQHTRPIQDLTAASCMHWATPVRQPILLISEVQRSGGTLMSQLFDGHAQVHAHPGELHIGYPEAENWPDLDPAGTPDTWFASLFELAPSAYAQNGYRKGGKDSQRYKFLFRPDIQYRLFLEHCPKSLSQNDGLRTIYDAYLTGYFNAWLDNGNLHGDKCLVTAFSPRLLLDEQGVARFFAAYPDGFMISMLRDPASWLASAQKHWPQERDTTAALLQRWIESAEAMVRNKHRYGAQVLIYRFEDVVADTAKAMRDLSQKVGLEFDESLTIPTFNGQPIRANTRFAQTETGVISAPINRGEDIAQADRDIVRSLTDAAYLAAQNSAENI